MHVEEEKEHVVMTITIAAIHDDNIFKRSEEIFSFLIEY